MSAYVLRGGAFKAKRVQDGIIDSLAHLPAMHGRRSERCFCRYFENITQRYFLHNKKQPRIRKTIPKTPAKIRGAIISILPVSLYRFKDVLFNYIAYRINRRFVKFFFGKNLGQTCKTEPAIPLHTCLPCVAGASQGAFVDIPEISQTIFLT